jgi:hypothetical protein
MFSPCRLIKGVAKNSLMEWGPLKVQQDGFGSSWNALVSTKRTAEWGPHSATSVETFSRNTNTSEGGYEVVNRGRVSPIQPLVGFWLIARISPTVRTDADQPHMHSNLFLDRGCREDIDIETSGRRTNPTTGGGG